jgi:hypothetical protein
VVAEQELGAVCQDGPSAASTTTTSPVTVAPARIAMELSAVMTGDGHDAA